MAVDFFFIVSGFYAARRLKLKGDNPFIYFKSRLIRLYPDYIIAYAFLALPYLITGKFLKVGYHPIYEILLIQNIGLPSSGGLNYPLWYLSVLFWGEIFLYTIIWFSSDKNKEVSVVILCVISIAGYALLFFSDYNTIEQWSYTLFLYHPLIRGLSDLSLGMILFSGIDKYSIHFKFDLSFFALLIIIVLMLTKVSDYFILALEVFLALQTLSFSSKSLYAFGNNKFIRFLSKYEYLAYLNHALVILVFEHSPISNNVLLRAIFIPICVLIVSIIIQAIKDLIISCFMKFKHIL